MMSLDPCPPSPNCVCSQEDPSDAEHFIEPIDYDGPADRALDVIAGVIESASRARITSRTSDRIDSVFTTPVLRFKDDVSFEVDSSAAKIHFRSASRVGHSDLGANRKRLESLRTEIEAGL